MENKIEIIQKNILDGRKVEIINSDKLVSLVRVERNSDEDESQKWRVIIDNQKFNTSEVKISCSARSLSKQFEGNLEKNHIVYESIGVIFQNNIASIY